MTTRETEAKKLAPYMNGDEWLIRNNPNAYRLAKARRREERLTMLALAFIGGGGLALGGIICLVGIIVYAISH